MRSVLTEATTVCALHTSRSVLSRELLEHCSLTIGLASPLHATLRELNFTSVTEEFRGCRGSRIATRYRTALNAG